MDRLQAEELTIEVTRESGALVAVWRGKSTSREPGKHLRPFFTTLLERAATQKLQVRMQFEQLEHFNSSTIAEVIQLIHSARTAGVPIFLHYDSTLRWQALSFEALRRAMQHFASGQGAQAKVEIVAVTRP